MEVNTYSLYNQYTAKLFVHKNSIWISSIGKPKIQEIDERKDSSIKIKRHKEYSFDNIQSIETNQTSQQVKIKYLKKDKVKTTRIQLSDIEEKALFISDIEVADFFEKELEKENSTKQNITNFIVAPLVFALAYYVFSIENLETSSLLNTRSTHRNRWVVDLLVLIIENLGQTTTALLIAAIGSFLVYKIIMRYKKPKNNIILTNPTQQN